MKSSSVPGAGEPSASTAGRHGASQVPSLHGVDDSLCCPASQPAQKLGRATEPASTLEVLVTPISTIHPCCSRSHYRCNTGRELNSLLRAGRPVVEPL
jgi:hypothetical protein